MRLTEHTDPATRERIVELRVTESDLRHVRLDAFDRRLLAECDAHDATIADRLLGLQQLAFRVEQGSAA